jgi:hypothetical protein
VRACACLLYRRTRCQLLPCFNCSPHVRPCLGHSGQSVAGVDDHPGFRTPSSPRRGSSGGGGGGSRSSMSPRSTPPRRNSIGSSASARDYDEERARSVDEMGDGLDDDDGRAWEAVANGGGPEEPLDDGEGGGGYYERSDRRLEETSPRGRGGEYGYNDDDGYADQDGGGRSSSRGRRGSGGSGGRERRGSSSSQAADVVTEPALGYPGSNRRRSISAGRNRRGAKAPSSPAAASSAMGRGSFASGNWVSAGGGSPRPDRAKKTATDRCVYGKREQAASLYLLPR